MNDLFWKGDEKPFHFLRKQNMYKAVKSFRFAPNAKEQLQFSKDQIVSEDVLGFERLLELRLIVKVIIDDGESSARSDVQEESETFKTSCGLTPIFEMSKDELEVYCRENFGIDIDKRRNIEKLRTQAASLAEEKGI